MVLLPPIETEGADVMELLRMTRAAIVRELLQ